MILTVVPRVVMVHDSGFVCVCVSMCVCPLVSSKQRATHGFPLSDYRKNCFRIHLQGYIITGSAPCGGHVLEQPSHPHVSNFVIVSISYGCGGANYLSSNSKSGHRLNRTGDSGTIGHKKHLSFNCHRKYKEHNPLGSSLGTSLIEM